MKRLWATFVLTPREQRLVIFVVLALVLGAFIRHHRDREVNESPRTVSEAALTPLVSPTPNEQ